MRDQGADVDAAPDGRFERLFDVLEVEPENDEVERLFRAVDGVQQGLMPSSGNTSDP